MRNGGTSFWMHRIGASAPTRDPLDGDREVDVCIVGAGYTGLWTAYWLREHLPSASILVLESHQVGHGASGRNGGWLSGQLVGSAGHLAHTPAGEAGVRAFRRACVDAVYEVLGLCAERGLDVDQHAGGYLYLARTPAGLQRLRQKAADEHALGLSEDDVRVLGADETSARVKTPDVVGGLYSPHGATIDPGKLVTSLAALLEESGVEIAERTLAHDLSPGRVQTDRGTVRARFVLRATEGYTARLAGHRRDILPLNSAMIVTRPLDSATWRRIGWDSREALGGAEHRFFYAQRTADDRIAIGGRGLPYRYGSRLDRGGVAGAHTVSMLKEMLVRLLPDVPIDIEHAWCGVLGVPRDWSPAVHLDASTRLGHAGGYAGQGVTAAYLAGQTLADLVAGRPTERSRLPWVGRRSPSWEPEPFRYVGAYAAYGMYALADAWEARTQRPRTALPARIADAVTGHG